MRKTITLRSSLRFVFLLIFTFCEGIKGIHMIFEFDLIVIVKHQKKLPKIEERVDIYIKESFWLVFLIRINGNNCF